MISFAKKFKAFLFLILVLCLPACEKQTRTQDECELISMRAYKGFPNSAHEFQKYCLDYEVKYSKDYCQSALEMLIKESNLNQVTEKYGELILNCFTENDLKLFSK